MEFIILWTFSQSWALKNLPNLYWVDADAAARHSVMEVFSALSSSVTFVEGGQAIEKDKQAESLYPAFCQRAGKMGAHRKAERSEPIYK